MLEVVRDKLKKLGFDNKGMEVYIACLQEEGGLFVVDIVDRVGLKRSTVDVVLNRLVDQGVMGFYLDGKRKRYTAEDPRSLVDSFENTVSELKQVLPQMYSEIGAKGRTRVRFYNGEESVLKMFEDMFLTVRTSNNKKKEILAVADLERMNKAVKNFQERIQKTRVEYGISLRVLSPRDQLSIDIQKHDKENLRQTKIFDGKKFPFKAAFNVYEGSVSLFRLEGKPSGVIIEDNDLADSIRALFELLWENFK